MCVCVCVVGYLGGALLDLVALDEAVDEDADEADRQAVRREGREEEEVETLKGKEMHIVVSPAAPVLFSPAAPV